MMKSKRSAMRRSGWIAAGILLAGIAPFSQAADVNPKSTVHVEKVLGTPHFYQEDPRGHFLGDGSNYCCPTSFSDSLVYLAAHGFPKLLPQGMADATDAQIALIKKLASPDCMKTDPKTGTDAGEACVGLQRYVEEAGYVCRTLEYSGWRPVPKAIAARQPAAIPALEWIKKAVANPHGAAWINIGWYVKGDAADEWKRVGGHWVAVVGYGVDAKGHEDPSVLLIDTPAVAQAKADPAKKPAPRLRLTDGSEAPTTSEIAAVVMTTELVDNGRLVGNYTGLPRKAAGMYQLSGSGVRMSKQYDAAFLDGAIVLEIADRKP